MESRRVLKAILVFGIVTTGIHFTHNFLKIEDYPASFIPNWVVQTAIIVSWPLFTLIAIRSYQRYASGDVTGARPGLWAYAAWTLFSLGHFTSGNPDIPPVFYATIFTDALAGLLLAAFLLWERRSSPATRSRDARSAGAT